MMLMELIKKTNDVNGGCHWTKFYLGMPITDGLAALPRVALLAANLPRHTQKYLT